ncbi:YadA-like family protein [Pseudomonas yamanorum]|uniref:YadA-like family protein n=2 Tax=Pseudomonas yamanorum TaxID=515393 RepID=UPI003F74D8AA
MSNVGGTGQNTVDGAISSVSATANKGWNVTAQGANGTNVAPGASVDLKNSDGNVVVSKDTTSNDVTFDLAKDLTADSLTTGSSKLDTSGLTVNDGTNSTSYASTGMTITNGPSVTTSGIDAGSLKITNVADGAVSSTSTDAVNGSQLNTTNTTVATNATNTNTYLGGGANVTNGTAPSYSVGGTTYNSVGDAFSAVDSGAAGVVQRTSTSDVATMVASGGTAANPGNAQKLTNLAAGTISSSSTDAVNGSQLDAVSQQANAGWNVTAQGANGTNVAPGASVDLKNSDGNVVVSKTTGSNDVTFDLAKDLTADSITTGNSKLDTNGLAVNDGTNSTTYASTGMTIANGPSVTTSGINAGSLKITNVADGTLSSTSTDAVNGSQLNTTNTTVATNATNTNTYLGGGANVTNGTAPSYSVGGTTYNSVGDAFSAVDSGAAGVVQRTSTSDVTTMVASGGTAANPGNAQKLTNLAAGTISSSSTDAVNGSQLDAVSQQANAGWNVTAQGANGTNVAPGASVDLKNSDGNVVVSKDTTSNDVTFDLAKDLTADSITTGNSKLDTSGLTVNDGTNSTSYASTGMTITNGPSVTTNGIDAGSLKVTNVADGTLSSTSKDAVNGSQLFSTNQTVDAVGNRVNQLGSTASTVLGGNATYDTATGKLSMSNVGGTGKDNVNDAISSVDQKAGAGWNLTAQGANSTNVAPGAAVDLKNSDGNVVVSKDTNSNDVTFNLAKDLTADSVTTGNTLLNTFGVQVGSDVSLGATGLIIANGPSVTTAGIDAGSKKITNVADGTDATDAVNLSQLTSAVAGTKSHYYSVSDGGTQGGNYNSDGATGTNAVAAGVGAAASSNNATALGSSTQATAAGATAVGSGAVASAAGATAAGNGSQASGTSSVAMGDGAKASADGSVALGSNASDGGRGAENYTGAYSGAQNDTVGTVSVGNASTGDTRTISNVADGNQATDAVNLRQLDGAVQESKTYTDTQMTSVNTSVTNLGNQVTQNTTNVSNLQNGTDGFFQVNNNDGKSKPSATGTNAAAGGAGSVASGNSSLALGTSASATADNAVALGSGSVADRAYSVSVGSAGNERQITNVAAGTASTDAVNVSQLQSSQQGGVRYDTNTNGTTNYSQVTLGNGQASGGTRISNVAAGTDGTDAVNLNQLNQGVTSANQYTDDRFNKLNRDIGSLRQDTYAGIAGALATANLPQAYSPGASMVSAGVGNYQGQSAVSVGLSTLSDNGKWVLKVSGSTNSRGQTGIGAGVGYQW